MFRNPRTRLIALIFTLVLFLGLTGGVTYLVYTRYFNQGGQSTETRSRASSASGDVLLTMEAATDVGTPSATGNIVHYTKDTFTVKLYLNTSGKHVSGVAFGLSYPSGTGTTPDLEVVDADPATAGVQITSNAGNLDPCFGSQPQVNLVTRSNAAGNKTMYIDYSALCANQVGYISPATGKELLATITFRGNAPGSFFLEHNPEKAIATDKATGADVLRTVNPLTVEIKNDTVKPTIEILTGPAQGSTVIDGDVTFTFKGTEVPARGVDTVSAPLTYAYKFDNMALWSAYTSSTAARLVVTHGAKTFSVVTKDGSGNISDILTRTFTANLTPNLQSALPAAAPQPDQIVLKGFNFGTVKNYVYFGTLGVNGAWITSWTNNEIHVIVPAGGTGDVKVLVPGAPGYSNAKPFTVQTIAEVLYNPEGITQDRGARTADVTFKPATGASITRTAMPAVWSTADGAYKITTTDLNTTTTPFVTGVYTVFVKDGSHLQRKFAGITMTKGTRMLISKKAAADKLKAGDFNNDNKLDIQDFGRMMSAVKGLSTATDATTKLYDLDGDGNITFLDIAMLLTNYTALQVPGDN